MHHAEHIGDKSSERHICKIIITLLEFYWKISNLTYETDNFSKYVQLYANMESVLLTVALSKFKHNSIYARSMQIKIEINSILNFFYYCSRWQKLCFILCWFALVGCTQVLAYVVLLQQEKFSKWIIIKIFHLRKKKTYLKTINNNKDQINVLTELSRVSEWN